MESKMIMKDIRTWGGINSQLKGVGSINNRGLQTTACKSGLRLLFMALEIRSGFTFSKCSKK